MDHAPHGVPEEIAGDLQEGETLVAATESDHRSPGGAAVGFIFSGLFSNLMAKGQEGETDEQLHLPYGPVLVAVTDKRILLFSRDVNVENGPARFVTELPAETIKKVRHGKDPLTDTLVFEFTDDTKFVLYLDTVNHSGHVIKGIRALIPHAVDADAGDAS